MKDLIERSYLAIRKRGLIKDDTCPDEFYEKIWEEFKEFEEAFLYGSKNSEVEELTDMINAGILYLKHQGYDFLKEFEKVVIKNETRKD